MTPVRRSRLSVHELTLLFAGFSVHQGWIAFPTAVMAGTLGNLAGSSLAYGIGASAMVDHVPGARAVLTRWDRLLARQDPRPRLGLREWTTVV